MTWVRAIVIIGALTALTDNGWAQRRVGGYHGVGVGVGLGLADPGFWGVGGFATTPAESYARGMAETIRAQGEANESNAQAMANYEVARSAYIDNQIKWQQYYRERQQDSLARRDAYYASERAKRERRQAMSASTASAPAANVADPHSGALDWPALLTGADFLTERQQLDELFVVRTQAGLTDDVAARIVETAKAMQLKLRGKIKDVPAGDYIEARKFLDQIAAEVHRRG